MAYVGWIALLVIGAAAPGQDRGAGPGPPEDRRQAGADLEALRGTWVVVSMEVEGEEVPLEGAAREAVYEGDRLTLRSDGETYRRAIVTLDPSRTPKAMNTWDGDGPFADLTIPGIYELEGDTLRVCFAYPGAERPKEFTTRGGSAFLYLVYERK